jgi:hypothetical protein
MLYDARYKDTHVIIMYHLCLRLRDMVYNGLRGEFSHMVTGWMIHFLFTFTLTIYIKLKIK